MPDQVFVIAGGGPCAVSATAGLRSAGFDGRIVLVAGEEHLPYERPPLSKDYLTGKLHPEQLTLRRSGWYSDQQIDLRLGTSVKRVDERAQFVVLTGGE